MLMCSSRKKKSIPAPWKVTRNSLAEGGVFKSKSLEAKYEAELEFPREERGGGGGGRWLGSVVKQKKKTFLGEEWIFFENAQIISSFMEIKSSSNT